MKTYTVTITLRNRNRGGHPIRLSTVLCGPEAEGLFGAADLAVTSVELVPEPVAIEWDADTETYRRLWAGASYNPLPVD